MISNSFEDSLDSLNLLFQSSLSTIPNSRSQAEDKLKSLQSNQGFLTGLLSFILSLNHPLINRQAAAIYLKNFIKLNYHQFQFKNHQNQNLIDSLNKFNQNFISISENDRNFLKLNILNAISTSPNSIKSLLLPTLSIIISTDYPDHWIDLLPQSINLISSNDFDSIQTGLFSLLEIFRLYRWSHSDKIQLFYNLINQSFPILIQLFQKILSSSTKDYYLSPNPNSLDEANSNIGTIIYLILKIYKTSITAHLPPFHQENIVPWTHLFITVISHPLKNSPGFSQSIDQNKWSWSKAKKWAYVILNRLYSRYGSPSQLPNNMLQYKNFAQDFISSFACPILRLYLNQVELFIQGQEWMSKKIICHTIVFFEESIRPKETWAVLKTHIQTLLPQFIFPLLCITEDEVHEFENQPEDYVKSQFGEFFEDICSAPSTIAAGFILALATGRKKSMFMNLLTFITDICAKYPQERSANEKDGALRSLAHLASVITETKSIRNNVEECFLTYVFPEFQSEHPFLRARTCEVVRKFETVGSTWLNPQLLQTAYQGIMHCLSDSSLPVRVQAALTLPEICEHPQIHESLAPHIGEIMQRQLRLSNEVDLDSLTQSARRLVSSFSNELLPFAADMAQALHQSYMRLMSEITDTRKRLGNEDDESSEEKVLVAMNILKTLQQLVVGLEGDRLVLFQVEASSLPLIKYTFKEEIVEIYDEALELLDSIQFSLKAITKSQWEVFEILYGIFKTSGADFVSEMFPSLDNFINYGARDLSMNPETINKFLDIYLTTMTSKSLSCSDRVVGCKLADSLLLCLKGKADVALPTFLEHSISIIKRGITTVDPITTKSLLMHAIEVVLNAISYNPALAMNVLIKHGWSTEFFREWFGRLSSFKRSHDKKLSLLAISAILSISLRESLDSILVQSSAQLIIGALSLFESLPRAIQTRYELEKEYTADSEDGSSTTSVDVGSDDEKGGATDDEDVVDRSEHINSIPTFSRNLKDDEAAIAPSSMWSDEILWETPLDRLDVYAEFAIVINAIESSRHPILNIITNELSAEQQKCLEKIVHQAIQGGEGALKSQIQQSVQTMSLMS
ncbi:hypothetical protein O181_043808 [Austropuccinia psidii MF-1]|uniref:Importin N-terminal domain-containing protein n=1 Tax=Austropuccinia psidii MF-1 TaxID=1389203 RepID=A0A9Q3DM67_9BASI|nr:hypothetical protein [Austropuccinia psidii MF-1]